jgi:hypothetical protein
MPTIAEGGRIVGTWRRTKRGKGWVLQPIPFNRWSAPAQRSFDRASADYGRFIGAAVHVDLPATA